MNRPSSGFVNLLGAGQLRNIVQNGMAAFQLHQCAQPSIIDKSGTFTEKEKAALARGLKVVDLTKKQKEEGLTQIVDVLNAKVVRNNGQVTVEVPETKFSKRYLGPVIGLNAQVVIVLPQPAENIILPELRPDYSLPNLHHWRDIGIFKKSDKGSSLVFLLKEVYRAMGLKYLNTPNYLVVTAETDNGLAAMQKLFDEAMKTEDCAKLIKGVCLIATRERYIYFLPKIHKDVDENGWWKVRPIVDCCNTALAAADKVAATFLAALNPHMTTIATSTIDLLRAINEAPSIPDAWFYTADVEDLYTNVNVDDAIKAIELLLDEFNIGSENQRKFIIEILNICLRNNLFWFGEVRYRQVHGIPMGSNSAPVVADAWLFHIERKLVSDCCNNGILVFKRYRDDIFAIATSKEKAEALDQGYKRLNERIKLDSQISNTKVNVLDVAISKFEEDGSLRLGVYFKATNSLPILHRRSNHPIATLRGAIKGRFISFIRICNNTTDLFSAILSLVNNANKYGYSEIELLGIAREAILQCSQREWPYLRPKDDNFSQDYRTNNVVRYVRGLERLYSAARKRKVKLSLSEGKNLLAKLQRTKDY